MSRAEALRGVPVVSSQHLSKPVAPQTEVPPSPLLGLHAPHSFVTFLLLFSSPQPGKPLLNWLFGAQTCITPLHDQPHPELVTPCQGSWVLCSEGVRLFTCLLPWLSESP